MVGEREGGGREGGREGGKVREGRKGEGGEGGGGGREGGRAYFRVSGEFPYDGARYGKVSIHCYLHSITQRHQLHIT